ncbi:hypothetical protein FRC01_010415, partial [Tulasnella sp. 417]
PHFRPEDRAEYVPAGPHYSRGPFDFPFDFHEPRYPPRYEHVPDIAQRSASIPHSLERINGNDQEHRIEEWFQHRRQHDLEEAQFRRLKELERRRDREMLAVLGIDSMERNRPTSATTTSSLRPTTRALEEELYHTRTPRQVPAHSQTHAWDGHIPTPQPKQASEPAFTSSTSSSLDFPTQLWNALSGGRSDNERASILQDLGLGVPFNVTHPSNTRQPTAEQRLSPAQRSTATPRPTAYPQTPRPAPARIPVIARSPALATPQSSTIRNPQASPAPVKLRPFAHIESIQTKLDSLRASSLDLSNPQKKWEYLTELNKLLTSLDEVESSGSESIRGARKALVRAVEEELEKVEGTQDEQKHEVAEEKQVEEAQVKAKGEEKPNVVEAAAPEPQASVEPVSQQVEIQSVSESEAVQIHPIEPTVEEPADELANAVAQHSESEPQASSEQVPSADETRPEAPATLIDVTASAPVDAAKPEVNVDEEKAHVASQDTEEQPQRGRQPTVPSQAPKSPRTRRPPSVEIEEVPDEESLSGSPQVGYRDL